MKALALRTLVVYSVVLCAEANGQGRIIVTVAGDGIGGSTGDGGPATSAQVELPPSVAVDTSGNLFFVDSTSRVRKVSSGGVITTIAGTGVQFFSGDGGPAISASLSLPCCVAVDKSGNLFISDGNRIRKVSSSGIITTVAGGGTSGLGDGGPATAAQLNFPGFVAVDAGGNLYIADSANARVREVSTGGIITTIAGGGTDYPGDGGPAVSAKLSYPYGVAIDSLGDIFITDLETVRKVSPSGIITTVAGTGGAGFAGDGGGPATAAPLNSPEALAVDASGNLFIADTNNNRIREVSSAGIISTVAGSGGTEFNGGFSGDGGTATSAQLNQPSGVAVDASGNIYIADTLNNRIREVLAQVPSLTVSPTSINLALTEGDTSSQRIGLAATAEAVGWSANTSTSWITLSPSSGTAPGTLTVVIDTASLQPGRYTASITISNPLASPPQETIAVSLTVTAPTATLSVLPTALQFQIQQAGPTQSQSIQVSGTAGTTWQATSATSTGGPWLAVSPSTGQIPATLTAQANWGGLTPGTYHGSISLQAAASPPVTTISITLTVTPGNNIVTVFAGGGTANPGDGGPATSAALTFFGAESDPVGLAVDASGNLLIPQGDRIRKVSPGGIITTVATSELFLAPSSVAVDASGNLFVADVGANVVWKVSPVGSITTVAGNGKLGFAGDNGPATLAELATPEGIATDSSGNLFIADTNNNRIREVSPAGTIITIAGSGSSNSHSYYGGYSGDGGPATSALLYQPNAVAVDASGNVFIADTGNNVVRRVSVSGIITTFAGNGVTSFSGDGGTATSAALMFPDGVAVDSAGDLFIADLYNNRIRKVSPGGIITTVAGGGSVNPGNGVPATSAALLPTLGVAVDALGNIFVPQILPGPPYSTSGVVSKVSNLAPTSLLGPAIMPGGIVPVDSTVSVIQPGEWISIFGANLASATVTWNGNFTTSLGGTSVTINGKAAYLSFVSPTQINVQTPSDSATGPVPVVVTSPGGTATSTVSLALFAPSFLLLDSQHVAGLIIHSNGSGAYGGGAYDILGPTGNSLGYRTVAAKAGDTVELFAVGLGPTSPSVPPGQPFSGAAPTVNAVSILIHGVSVPTFFAGLSSAGLYQINLTIPAGLGTGDIPLAALVGGSQHRRE
jgi:uncharacterized protein (TIGR03437 family)